MWSRDIEQKVGRVLDCISKGATALSEAGATVYTMSNALQKQGISNLLHSEARKQDTTLTRTAHGHIPHTMTQFEPRDNDEKRAVIQLRLERAMREQDASSVRHFACELDKLEADGCTAWQGTEAASNRAAANVKAVHAAAHPESRTLQSPSSNAHLPNAPNTDDAPRASCTGHTSAAFAFPHNSLHHYHLYSQQPRILPGCNWGEHPPYSALTDGLDNEAACATGWAGASAPWCQCAACTHRLGLMHPPPALSPFAVPHTPGPGTVEHHFMTPDVSTEAMATQDRVAAQATKAGRRHPVHATSSSLTEIHKSFASTHSNPIPSRHILGSTVSSAGRFHPSRSLCNHPSICAPPSHSMPSLL